MLESKRKEIYSCLDKEGICGRYSSVVSLLNSETDEIALGDVYSVFNSNLHKFGLSQPEATDVIIEYIYDTLNIRISHIRELEKYCVMDRSPFILKIYGHFLYEVVYKLAFGKIVGNFEFGKVSNINTLGNIEEIEGNLSIIDCELSNLGKLRKISGSLTISQSWEGVLPQIETFNNLEFVGGDLNLKHTKIKGLGVLKFIGGNLNLRNTEIVDLGDVKFIGGNLLLPAELKNKINTSKITIKGKIKYFKDSNFILKELNDI